MDSTSLATSFIARAAARVETLIGAALNVPAQALTSLAVAQQAIAGQIAAQTTANFGAVPLEQDVAVDTGDQSKTASAGMSNAPPLEGAPPAAAT